MTSGGTRLIDRLCDLVALVGFAGLLLLTVFIAADVVARWVFNSPLHGVNDISAVLIAVVITACLPASLRSRRHLTIVAAGKAIGPRAAAVLDAFGAIVLLFILGLVAWQFVDYTVDKFRSGNTTWILRLPTGPWWAVVTVLFFACVVVQAMMVWHSLRRVFGAEVESASGEGSVL